MTERAAIAVGYVRVSTVEQANSGAGLAAQRAAIERACTDRGWPLLDVLVDAGVSGKTQARPGLDAALSLLETRAASVLVVAKLDRLSRSMRDLVNLLDRARASTWQLLALDVGLDTTSPHGEFHAHLIAAVAQLERRLISERTREALAAKAAQGVIIGRPSMVSPHVVRRIVTERAAGRTLQAIADTLNTDGIATTRGAPTWERSTVHRILRTRLGRNVAAEVTE